jgi:hypothetical protein
LAECFKVYTSASQGRQTISDAIAALQASFPAEFEFSAVALPAPNHDVRRLFRRLGPAGSPPVVNGMGVAQFKDGHIRSLLRLPERLAPLGAVADMLTG